MNAQTLTRIEEVELQETDLIDVDMPFSAQAVERATFPGYVEHLTRSDMTIVAANRRSFIAAGRKSRAALPTDHVFDPIDIDMPFSIAEMAALTSEAFVAALGRSDLPVLRVRSARC